MEGDADGSAKARLRREAANKDAIVSFFTEVLARGRPGALEGVATDYEPHVPDFAGLPALASGRGALAERVEQNGPLRPTLYRLVADGDLVFVQARYDGPVPVAGADIFRFDGDGRIAEHWNSRQSIGDDAARGIDRFAGGGDADASTGTQRREEIRRTAQEVMDIWRRGDAALVGRYYDEGYIQHNPDMPGGSSRIREVLATDVSAYIKATGGPFPVDCHRIGVEGDLIFVNYSVSMVGINRSGGARSTNTDVFRINDRNLMIEHWDVLQIEGEHLPDLRTLF